MKKKNILLGMAAACNLVFAVAVKAASLEQIRLLRRSIAQIESCNERFSGFDKLCVERMIQVTMNQARSVLDDPSRIVQRFAGVTDRFSPNYCGEDISYLYVNSKCMQVKIRETLLDLERLTPSAPVVPTEDRMRDRYLISVKDSGELVVVEESFSKAVFSASQVEQESALFRAVGAVSAKISDGIGEYILTVSWSKVGD